MNPGGSDASQLTATQHSYPYCYLFDPHDFAFDQVPSYAPSGERLAFNERSREADGGGSDDLEVINADGTNRHTLFRTSACGAKPAFSPDGRWLAFGDGGAGPTGCWISVMRSDGTNKHRLTKVTAGGFDFDPTFFPNGKTIAFVSSSRTGAARMFTIRLDGSHLQPLTAKTKEGLSSPDVSPDGSRIVFGRTVGGRDGIYVMWPDGTHERRLAHGSDPVFSPNGKRIAFSSATSSCCPSDGMALGRITVMIGRRLRPARSHPESAPLRCQ